MEVIMQKMFPLVDKFELKNNLLRHKEKNQVKVDCDGACENASCLGDLLFTDFVLNTGQFNLGN